jgi:hypothetical protein
MTGEEEAAPEVDVASVRKEDVAVAVEEGLDVDDAAAAGDVAVAGGGGGGRRRWTSRPRRKSGTVGADHLISLPSRTLCTASKHSLLATLGG